MPCKIKNKYGMINIENEVVARIAGMAAMECYGVVGMAAKSVKDGLVHLLKIESLTKGIRINEGDKNINIDLHIIAEYGTNITAICESLMSAVKYKVEEICGLAVGQINVYVEGLRVDE
ncbi:MAG: Asp23/Gls24 family envelope stress response protein [Defluviitaleaceae bacterium]|nr:Asp23/Gls24 family envelope stress response protein [Defluviitaleaceae bacterium]